MHVDVTDKSLVAEINRITAMFAYRYIFGKDEKYLSLGKRYNSKCPVADYSSSIIGDGVVYKIGYKFGKPVPIKNSWQYDFAR